MSEEMIAVCTECKSDNPDSYVNSNPFFQGTGSHNDVHVPCKYCKGRLVFVTRARRESVLMIEDRRRGLSIDRRDPALTEQKPAVESLKPEPVAQEPEPAPEPEPGTNKDA